MSGTGGDAEHRRSVVARRATGGGIAVLLLEVLVALTAGPDRRPAHAPSSVPPAPVATAPTTEPVPDPPTTAPPEPEPETSTTVAAAPSPTVPRPPRTTAPRAPRAPVPRPPRTTVPPPVSGFGPSGGRPFGLTSAWNLPIPPNPMLDPGSREIVSRLASAPHPGIADLYEYGVPVWDAEGSTPTYHIDCVRPWGACELEQQRVPIPAEAVPSSGSDAAMVVIQWPSRRAFEFWEASRVDGGWQAGWGGVVDVDGAGTPGRAVGAGVSRLAGLVRTYEMGRGRIDHALVFSTDNACRDVHRYPATKTDGRSSRSDCIPQGARIQLDPAVDVDAIPGITRGEKVVARALQAYGAYAIDNGGARMAFIFETPSGEADPYPASGFSRDYFAMDRIPWGRLRVLRAWNGS